MQNGGEGAARRRPKASLADAARYHAARAPIHIDGGFLASLALCLRTSQRADGRRSVRWPSGSQPRKLWVLAACRTAAGAASLALCLISRLPSPPPKGCGALGLARLAAWRMCGHGAGDDPSRCRNGRRSAAGLLHKRPRTAAHDHRVEPSSATVLVDIPAPWTSRDARSR